MFAEKDELCFSIPFLSGMAAFASPGAQVGATWAQQTESNGSKLQVGGGGQSSLAGRFGLAGGVMEITPTPPRLKSSRRYKSK